MGQRPLYPPNVSGWKHNGYWVNASAMAQRTATAQSFGWRIMSGFWSGDVPRLLRGASLPWGECLAMGGGSSSRRGRPQGL